MQRINTTRHLQVGIHFGSLPIFISYSVFLQFHCTAVDICEDPEIRERIVELKTEQESKRLREAQGRRVRRSQSINTRTQSVRRTSIRDKVLTTKKDAQEEARLRLQAQQVRRTCMMPKNAPSISRFSARYKLMLKIGLHCISVC